MKAQLNTVHQESSSTTRNAVSRRVRHKANLTSSLKLVPREAIPAEPVQLLPLRYISPASAEANQSRTQRNRAYESAWSVEW